MTPLFACFPICLTFVALAVLGLLVLATGMHSRSLGAADTVLEMRSSVDEAATGPPRWWVVALIFAAVVLAWVLLALVSSDMDGVLPREIMRGGRG